MISRHVLIRQLLNSIGIYLKLCSTYSIIYLHMNIESVDGGHILVSIQSTCSPDYSPRLDLEPVSHGRGRVLAQIHYSLSR